jgi:ABC-2 type transport system ATP-binding protein
VVVSSHLMSEMALTADEVVVIGKGRLITQTPVQELTASSSGGFVTVRSPTPEPLAAALRQAGASVAVDPDGAMTVRAMTAEAIGDLALAHGLGLHELAPHLASLEEAFMELTDASIEYRGHTDIGAGVADGGAR